MLKAPSTNSALGAYRPRESKRLLVCMSCQGNQFRLHLLPRPSTQHCHRLAFSCTCSVAGSWSLPPRCLEHSVGPIITKVIFFLFAVSHVFAWAVFFVPQDVICELICDHRFPDDTLFMIFEEDYRFWPIGEDPHSCDDYHERLRHVMKRGKQIWSLPPRRMS